MRAMVRIAFLVLAVMLLVVFLQVVAATPQADAVRGETGKRLDEYLKRLEKFGFSGAAMTIVGADGEIGARKTN